MADAVDQWLRDLSGEGNGENACGDAGKNVGGDTGSGAGGDAAEGGFVRSGEESAGNVGNGGTHADGDGSGVAGVVQAEGAGVRTGNDGGRAEGAGVPSETGLIGGESTVVPGRFGEPLEVREVRYSRGGGAAAPARPMFLCLHGWGSNEADLADMMRYVAPYNDFASLRAPLVLDDGGRGEFGFGQGAYSWFHDCVPTGDDLDRDAFAAASAIDRWVAANVPDGRDVVPIGFSQGGLLAVHLLRVHPERYRAAVCLSGFLAPGRVPGSAPADARLESLDRSVFYAYGQADTVIPKYELHAMAAWLGEHTWLTTKSYRGLDHAVSLEEFSDLRGWLAEHDIAPGVL